MCWVRQDRSRRAPRRPFVDAWSCRFSRSGEYHCVYVYREGGGRAEGPDSYTYTRDAWGSAGHGGDVRWYNRCLLPRITQERSAEVPQIRSFERGPTESVRRRAAPVRSVETVKPLCLLAMSTLIP